MKIFATLMVALSIVVVVIGIAAGFGVRMGWWGFPTGFTLLEVAFVSALICVVLSLILFAVGLAKRIPIRGRALFALLVSGSVAAVPYLSVTEFRKIPTFGDASTDFQSLPAFDALAEVPRASAQDPPNFSLDEAEAAQEKYFPGIGPVELKQDPEQAKQEVTQVLQQMELSLASTGGDQLRIEATETSFWFGFKDDVVVRVKPLSDGGSQIDVRSASRVGKFDGGANAKRVMAILTGLQQDH